MLRFILLGGRLRVDLGLGESTRNMCESEIALRGVYVYESHKRGPWAGK